MIFRRALLRELSGSSVTVFSALFAIVVSMLVVRYLSEAAGGSITSFAVVPLLGFSLIGYLPILLSLSLFIAILLTLTRSYRDNEMVVWFTSGQSLTAWIQPVLLFSFPVVMAIAVLSFVLAPWSLQKSNEFRQQLDSRDDVSAVIPGAFKESKKADRVYFVEKVSEGQKTVSNVFIQSVQNGRLGVMVAQHGYETVADNKDRFLVLLNGRRYEGQAGSQDFRMIEFARYALRIQTYEAKGIDVSPKSLSTQALIQDRTPSSMGELLWRAGLPISALLLALLAIPLSFVNPRAGRSLNLIMAILTYMIYSNLISIAQAWVAQGRVGFSMGMWVVHVAMALLLAALFYQRLSLSPLVSLLRRR